MSEPRVWNKYDPKCPPGAVYVGRGSRWGNPFRISFAQTREQVIERFRCEVLPTLDVTQLAGKDLVCYCAPKPCHADLLLIAASSLPRVRDPARSPTNPNDQNPERT